MLSSHILPIFLPNFAKIEYPLNVLKFNFSNFISFWNTLILSTCWAQPDVFGIKSKGFSKIRQITTT